MTSLRHTHYQSGPGRYRGQALRVEQRRSGWRVRAFRCACWKREVSRRLYGAWQRFRCPLREAGEGVGDGKK